jgi:hypothetical protein
MRSLARCSLMPLPDPRRRDGGQERECRPERSSVRSSASVTPSIASIFTTQRHSMAAEGSPRSPPVASAHRSRDNDLLGWRRSGMQGNGRGPYFRAWVAALPWLARSARARKMRQVSSLRRFTFAPRNQMHALLRSSEPLHILSEFRRPRVLPGCRVRCSGSHSCPRTRDRKTCPHRRHTSASDARSTLLPMNFRLGSKAWASRPSQWGRKRGGDVAAPRSPTESCAVGTK